MKKLGEKLEAVQSTEDGTQFPKEDKGREGEEGKITGTVIPEGTVFVTSANINKSAIAKGIGMDPFLKNVEPVMQQAFLDLMDRMLNQCAIVSQAPRAPNRLPKRNRDHHM